jgi:hypothetical protein
LKNLQRGEDVTELKPLLSPTGEWIAFTVVHWKDGYVAPAVICPMGVIIQSCFQMRAMEMETSHADVDIPLIASSPLTGKGAY